MMQGGRLSGLSKAAMILKRNSGVQDEVDKDKSPSDSLNSVASENQEKEPSEIETKPSATGETSDTSNSDSACRSSLDSQGTETHQTSGMQEKHAIEQSNNSEDPTQNDSSVSDKAEASFDSAIEESSSPNVTMDTTSCGEMDVSSPDHAASIKTESVSDQRDEAGNRQMDSVSSQDDLRHDSDVNMTDINQDSENPNIMDNEDHQGLPDSENSNTTQLFIQTEDMDEDVNNPDLVDSNAQSDLQESRRIVLNPADIDMEIEDPNSPSYSPNLHSDDSKWPLAVESQTPLPVIADMRS